MLDGVRRQVDIIVDMVASGAMFREVAG